MSTAVILSACRTPIGKFQGTLGTVGGVELGSVAIRAALSRAAVAPDLVDDVIMGMVLPAGVGQAPARQAAIRAGVPASKSAVTVNKVCGSGLQAVMQASQAVRCGDANLIVAGGMESMSQSPWLIKRQLSGLGDQTLTDSMIHDGLRCTISQLSMGEIGERLAAKQGISRKDQDAFACESHRRAIAAQRDGLFQDEIIPVPITIKGTTSQVSTDEGPRADCSIEGLAKLRPAFIANGTVTAGNAAMISDGAAAVVVTSSAYATDQSLVPCAEIVASTTGGVEPEDLFVAPVEAIRKLLSLTKLRVPDVDLWEINEAFAVQMLACQRMLEIPADRLNRRGGAISLGHPIGASGARVLTTLIHTLRQENRELGVASLCLGGGNAVAMLVRRLS